MSWLRTSPLRQSLSRSSPAPSSTASSSTPPASSTNRRPSPPTGDFDFDQKACYDSFCKHWQQVYDIIILRTDASKPAQHDDVVGVVNHLDHMVTLLLVELQHCNRVQLPVAAGMHHSAPCQEFLLSENLLDKLYEWSRTTGRYADAVRQEQLKLYELLVSHSRHQVLVHEPFLRPLLKLLASSAGEIYPMDIEKRLVVLLNQLCVVLMQNVHLLDLFFCSSTQQSGGSDGGHGTTNFIIFSLLIPYVHRDGSLGHQARDALLLCMALSQKNDNVGTYIARHSAMCTVLVNGLGGLYLALPASIDIATADWHRITADDVADIGALTAFVNSLEFCNAVVQVAHEQIRDQLLDVMYMGFIVPVLGPALLQTFKGIQHPSHLQNDAESQISAMAYLDLIVRSVTEPGLLTVFVRFLLDAGKFDGQRMLDVLVDRIGSMDSRLCMVTLSLFDTLLSLQNEGIMRELLLKFLLPGRHVPIVHRHKVNRIDGYALAVEHFLDLTPEVMKVRLPAGSDADIDTDAGDVGYGGPQSLQLHQQQQHHHHNQHRNQHQSLATATPSATIAPNVMLGISRTIGANWNHYGLHSNASGDSLYANYRAYLFDARQQIAVCQRSCSRWSQSYRMSAANATTTGAVRSRLRLRQQLSAKTIDLIRDFLCEHNNEPSSTSTTTTKTTTSPSSVASASKQPDSLQSLGESIGYESFKCRVGEEAGEADSSGGDDDRTTASASTSPTSSSSTAAPTTAVGGSMRSGRQMSDISTQCWRTSSRRRDMDGDAYVGDSYADGLGMMDDDGAVSLGPFLTSIWGKLQTFTSNCLFVNLHLTGLISRLAWYPLPLTHSVLLRPDIPTSTLDAPSFHQLLRILKQQIDAELPVSEDSLELVDLGRADLIDREFRLIAARRTTGDVAGGMQSGGGNVSAPSAVSMTPTLTSGVPTTTAQLSASTPPQATASSLYDPFRRGESKRRSITTSLSNIFKRQPNAANNNNNGGNGSGGGNNSSNGNHAPTSSSPSTSSPSPSSTKKPSTSSSSSLTQILEFFTGHPISTHHQQPQHSTADNVATDQLQHHHQSQPNSLELMSSMTSAILGGGGSLRERSRDLALCAIILDEWLKELSAIALEHSVSMLEVRT